TPPTGAPMSRPPRIVPPLLALALLLGGGEAARLHAAEPQLLLFQTQQVGDVIYFRLQLSVPDDLSLPRLSAPQGWGEAALWDLARLPRLVPQDSKAREVYLRLAMPRVEGGPIERSFTKALEFTGRLEARTEVRFVLLYPTEETIPVPRPERDAPGPMQ